MPHAALLATVLCLGTASATLLQSSHEAPVTFTDRTEAAGIDFTHVRGSSGEKYMAEIVGAVRRIWAQARGGEFRRAGTVRALVPTLRR